MHNGHELGDRGSHQNIRRKKGAESVDHDQGKTCDRFTQHKCIGVDVGNKNEIKKEKLNGNKMPIKKWSIYRKVKQCIFMVNVLKLDMDPLFLSETMAQKRKKEVHSNIMGGILTCNCNGAHLIEGKQQHIHCKAWCPIKVDTQKKMGFALCKLHTLYSMHDLVTEQNAHCSLFL